MKFEVNMSVVNATYFCRNLKMGNKKAFQLELTRI
jgi:hypothetical protein